MSALPSTRFHVLNILLPCVDDILDGGSFASGIICLACAGDSLVFFFLSPSVPLWLYRFPSFFLCFCPSLALMGPQSSSLSFSLSLSLYVFLCSSLGCWLTLSLYISLSLPFFCLSLSIYIYIYMSLSLLLSHMLSLTLVSVRVYLHFFCALSLYIYICTYMCHCSPMLDIYIVFSYLLIPLLASIALCV